MPGYILIPQVEVGAHSEAWRGRECPGAMQAGPLSPGISDSLSEGSSNGIFIAYASLHLILMPGGYCSDFFQVNAN